MTRLLRTSWLLLALAALDSTVHGDDPLKPPGGDGTRVYGEWRIRVEPDQGPDYDRSSRNQDCRSFARPAGGWSAGGRR